MRPRMEVREAIIAAIAQGPCTMRDAAERARVGYDAAAFSVKNAVRSGELVVVGREKRAHSKRWCALYELAKPDAKPTTPLAVAAEVLAMSMRAWCQTPPQFDGAASR